MRALPFEPEAVAEAKRTKVHAASVPVIHLRKALRLGILAESKPEAIVRVAVNALQTEARCLGKEFGPEQARRFLQLYGVPVAPGQLAAIVADEARFAPMNVEDRGDLLTLSKGDRLAHRVWMIGAHGQTKEDREAEREERQRLREAARNLRGRLERAATRDPLHVNVSEVAKSLGLNRRTVQKLHADWKAKVQADGGTPMHISEPCKEFVVYAGQVCAEPVPPVTPWEEQGVSRRTYFRRKAAGRVEPASGPADGKRSLPYETEGENAKAGRKLALPNRTDVTNVVRLPFYVSPAIATSAVRCLDFLKPFPAIASPLRRTPPLLREVRHGR